MTPPDRGNGTVLSLGFMCAIAAAGLLVLAQVQAVIKTHAVQGAADLTAIAAAQAAGDACANASTVAEANRVRLVECEMQDNDYVVRVEADLPNFVAVLLDFAHVQYMPIQASARAGFD